MLPPEVAPTIRLAAEQDGEAVRAIYAPVVERTAISFESDPPTAAEMRRRILATLERLPWIVVQERDEVLGYAYAARHRERACYRWSVDAAVYVAEAHRGRGVGRALYGSLFEILRLQRFANVFAGITLPNDASVALHKAMGFQPVGIYRQVGHKFGAWHDTSWWQLALTEKSSTPRIRWLWRKHGNNGVGTGD
jgi:phosphinothricin acetyltransferase